MHNSGHSAPPAVHAVFRRPTAGADSSADAEARPGARRRFLRQRGTRTGFPTEPHHRNVTKIGKIIRQRLLPLRKSPSLAKNGRAIGKNGKGGPHPPAAESGVSLRRDSRLRNARPKLPSQTANESRDSERRQEKRAQTVEQSVRSAPPRMPEYFRTRRGMPRHTLRGKARTGYATEE